MTYSARVKNGLAELNVFLTVARERSFSRAALKLYRTQPAVSIAVRRLEEWGWGAAIRSEFVRRAAHGRW